MIWEFQKTLKARFDVQELTFSHAFRNITEHTLFKFSHELLKFETHPKGTLIRPMSKCCIYNDYGIEISKTNNK